MKLYRRLLIALSILLLSAFVTSVTSARFYSERRMTNTIVNRLQIHMSPDVSVFWGVNYSGFNDGTDQFVFEALENTEPSLTFKFDAVPAHANERILNTVPAAKMPEGKGLYKLSFDLLLQGNNHINQADVLVFGCTVDGNVNAVQESWPPENDTVTDPVYWRTLSVSPTVSGSIVFAYTGSGTAIWKWNLGALVSGTVHKEDILSRFSYMYLTNIVIDKVECICELHCTTANDPDCPVCVNHPQFCVGVKCECETKCTEDHINEECLVCTTDLERCTGIACTCQTKCSDTINDECALCASHSELCDGTECVCTEKCTAESIHPNCKLCNTDISNCIGAQETTFPESTDEIPADSEETTAETTGSTDTEELPPVDSSDDTSAEDTTASPPDEQTGDPSAETTGDANE